MLGEQIGEETGQITGTRVLPDEGAGPKVDVSFQASRTALGVQGNNIVAYMSVAGPAYAAQAAGWSKVRGGQPHRRGLP